MRAPVALLYFTLGQPFSFRLSLSHSLLMYIYIYIHTCKCGFLCIYRYVRARWRESKVRMRWLYRGKPLPRSLRRKNFISRFYNRAGENRKFFPWVNTGRENEREGERELPRISKVFPANFSLLCGVYSSSEDKKESST